MTSVLIVEDELPVLELVSTTLEDAGYRVHEATDGETAVDLATRVRLDLIVLDLGLPGIDGWEVFRRIRERANIPVVFLTARDDEASTIRGLRMGGDDYLTKPFSPAVLAAHVEAILRRAAAIAPPGPVRVGPLQVDLARGQVRRGGVPVHLTPTEFRIVATLAQRPDQLVTSRELIRAAQGYDIAEAEAHPIVKVHVRNIRRKIEPEPARPRYLLRVRGQGFMLSAGA